MFSQPKPRSCSALFVKVCIYLRGIPYIYIDTLTDVMNVVIAESVAQLKIHRICNLLELYNVGAEDW